MPWDLDDGSQVRLTAEDDVANRAEVSFVDRFFPKPPATDRIGLSDRFMARVVPEILRRTPGLADRVQRTEIYREQRFSDHAPLTMDYAYDLEAACQR